MINPNQSAKTVKNWVTSLRNIPKTISAPIFWQPITPIATKTANANLTSFMILQTVTAVQSSAILIVTAKQIPALVLPAILLPLPPAPQTTLTVHRA